MPHNNLIAIVAKALDIFMISSYNLISEYLLYFCGIAKL